MRHSAEDMGAGIIVSNGRVFITELDQPFTSKESAEIHARAQEKVGYDTHVRYSAFSGNWYVYVREKGR